MQEKIVITIKPDGSTDVDAKNFTGGICKDATRPFEEALGLKAKDVDKPELHQEAKAAHVANQY